MSRLKGIYFYFLALKIILHKFLKEFYFSTKFYNNSLIEKYPKDFHPGVKGSNIEMCDKLSMLLNSRVFDIFKRFEKSLRRNV